MARGSPRAGRRTTSIAPQELLAAVIHTLAVLALCGFSQVA
jgi:hypothetical protein